MKEKKIKNIDLKDVIIKKTTLSDFDFFCQIKSEPSVIYWSGFKKKPNCTQLKKWFKKILLTKRAFLNKKRIIYIIHYAGEKAGFFYFDILNKNTIEISIAISEKFQGKGLGRTALKKIIKMIKRDYKKPAIIAWIFDINIASINVFTRNGFFPTDETKRKTIRLKNKKEIMRKYIYLWK